MPHIGSMTSAFHHDWGGKGSQRGPLPLRNRIVKPRQAVVGITIVAHHFPQPFLAGETVKFLLDLFRTKSSPPRTREVISDDVPNIEVASQPIPRFDKTETVSGIPERRLIGPMEASITVASAHSTKGDTWDSWVFPETYLAERRPAECSLPEWGRLVEVLPKGTALRTFVDVAVYDIISDVDEFAREKDDVEDTAHFSQTFHLKTSSEKTTIHRRYEDSRPQTIGTLPEATHREIVAAGVAAKNLYVEIVEARVFGSVEPPKARYSINIHMLSHGAAPP